MVLDSLLELVNTLRERIDEHGAALRQNEALTRAALIDPLLRELGWDTEDPELVIPEFRSTAGSADYALMIGGEQPPGLIIEAKKLGESLDDRVALQSLNYCNLIGTPHFALTDGKSWKIYSTFEQAPLADRLITTFSIGEMPAAEICLYALALWRPNVETANVVAAQRPIVRSETITAQSDVAKPAREDSVALSVQPTTEIPPPMSKSGMPPRAIREQYTQPDYGPARDVGEWTPLTELRPQPYSKPAEIILPDSSKVAIQTWRSVPIEATRWLIDNGLLGPEHCPIKYSESAKRHILAISPYHPDGKDFTAPEHVKMLYLNTHYSGANLVRIAMTIIHRTGQDPSQFKVRLR